MCKETRLPLYIINTSGKRAVEHKADLIGFRTKDYWNMHCDSRFISLFQTITEVGTAQVCSSAENCIALIEPGSFLVAMSDSTSDQSMGEMFYKIHTETGLNYALMDYLTGESSYYILLFYEEKDAARIAACNPRWADKLEIIKKWEEDYKKENEL